MSPVLELVDVTKQYPGTPPILALDNVSLAVDAGELLAIVGPSGSGKSTLMNVIGTLDRPSSGQVLIEGRQVSELSDAGLAGLRSARIGFVFQQFHLLEGSSAIDNVATGLVYKGIRRQQRLRKAADALDRVGLGHRLDQKPPKMSGGERQRVAIARAIVGDPAIVLADEPTGNLDSHTSTETIGLMQRLNDEGSTIIVITHDRDVANGFPRQVAMRDGAIVAGARSVATVGDATSATIQTAQNLGRES